MSTPTITPSVTNIPEGHNQNVDRSHVWKKAMTWGAIAGLLGFAIAGGVAFHDTASLGSLFKAGMITGTIAGWVMTLGYFAYNKDAPKTEEKTHERKVSFTEMGKTSAVVGLSTAVLIEILTAHYGLNFGGFTTIGAVVGGAGGAWLYIHNQVKKWEKDDIATHGHKVHIY